MVIYDEQLRPGIPAALGLAVLLLVLGVAVIALTRAEHTHTAPHRAGV